MKTSMLTRNWDALDKRSILSHQGKVLNHFLRRKVLPFSKHYSQLFHDHKIEVNDIRTAEDLQRLPFTSKEDLLSTPENTSKIRDFILIPDSQLLARQPEVFLRALMRGKARVKEELEREYRPIFMTSTTGRSTEPIPFLYTQHDLRNLAVSGARIVEIAHAEKEDRILNVFPYAPHLAYWQVHFGALEKNLFCLGSGGGKVTGTEGSIQLIKKIKPTVLIGMPTFIYHILNQAMEEGEHFENLRLIILGGEKVVAGTRRKLSDLCATLGSPNVSVVATYAFTESRMAWVECPFHRDELSAGYHLYPDMGIVEIINPETGEVRPDGEGGEIVYTPLNSRGTVILRYRTGDFIDGGINYEPCPHCGRQLARLEGKISRISDVRSMQLQKVKGTLVNFNDLEFLLDSVDAIGAWQLELRKVNDDPLEIDELILHISKQGSIDNEALINEINSRFSNATEIRPNHILFHSAKDIRKLHKVGQALKEEKIVDNREKPKDPICHQQHRHRGPTKAKSMNVIKT